MKNLIATSIAVALLSCPLLQGAPSDDSVLAFRTLHGFGAGNEGSDPEAALALGPDGNFYGTTAAGGTNGGMGTVFEIATNGVLTSIYSFHNGSDGGNPVAGLVLGADGNFYGTAYAGGNGYGTIFKITTNGILTSLYVFTNGVDGANPFASLTQASDGSFYGTATRGGTNGDGTLFKITANGVLTPLYSFTNGVDGGAPRAAMVQGSDGSFYGAAEEGGTNDNGTIFKITTNGILTSLYLFTNGADGSVPETGLLASSNGDLYGTASNGGTNDAGTVFAITTSGVLTPLYSFTNGIDGASPDSTLVQGADGSLYGATGGTFSSSTLFKITTNGALTLLYTFTNGADGSGTGAAFVQGSNGNLYGTATGGITGDGNVFDITTNGVLAVLHSFAYGLDGKAADGGVIRGSDGNFYGTTAQGGSNNNGTVFRMTPNGTFTSLYSFTNGVDGADPHAALTQGTDGNLYGVAAGGGANQDGSVFKITSAGALTPLYSFNGGVDGAQPIAPLLEGSDGNFYGSTLSGGTNNHGTVFKITTNGVLTSLYSFTGGDDGSQPYAGLVAGNDGAFYGSTIQGGSNGLYGTIFKITTNGLFTSLHSFASDSNGFDLRAALVQGVDGNFYGMALSGGASGNGTVFQFTTNGTFTSLYLFTGGSDGASPYGGLTLGPDGNLYGQTSAAGTNGKGTVFKITTNGVLTPLYSFTNGIDGGHPTSTLAFSGYTLYGTTQSGGPSGLGTVFALDLPTATVTVHASPSADGTAGTGGIFLTGSTITVNATNNTGYAFTGWTSNGVSTVSTPAYTFTVNSDATVAANFLPLQTLSLIVRPANAGTASANGSPGGGQFVEGSQVQLTATANDGFGFVGWTSNATGTNNPLSVTITTNLTIVANFAAETNITVSVTTNGSGSVTPNENGKSIKSGASLSLKATAAKGFVFSNWTGTITTNENPLKLSHLKASLALQANFVTNPFPEFAGSYNGLFTATNGIVTAINAGMIKGLTLTSNGTYSGSLLINGASHPLTGAFSLDLNATNTIAKTKTEAALSVVMTLTPNNPAPQITGSVTTTNWASTNLLADQAAGTVPSRQYTLLIQPDTNILSSPIGFGYASITNVAGKNKIPSTAKITGALADGTTFSQTTPVSGDGYIPLYVNPASGQNLLLGWINLTNTSAPGTLAWVHPKIKTGLFSTAFTSTNQTAISTWTNPATASALPTNLALIESTNSEPEATNNFTITITNGTLKFGKATGPSTPLTGSIDPKTGLVQMTIGSGPAKETGHGVMMQNSATGAGYFLTKTNAGAIELTP